MDPFERRMSLGQGVNTFVSQVDNFDQAYAAEFGEVGCYLEYC